jgi:hypothetical protein
MAKISKKLFFIGLWLVFVSLFLVLFSGVKSASAASLYFSPSSGSYSVGQTFSVSVYVSSPDQAMNAASGVINFPKDKMEILSLSKSNSIFSLWVQEPSFSNDVGVVNFEGIVLNPGFIGQGGKIITLTFKVKDTGGASLSFANGSVLANDGEGTNILKELATAQFNFVEANYSVPNIVTENNNLLNLPSAPQVSSPTHPDPNKWYATSTAKFVWNLPNDVTAVRLLYDKYPNSQPTVVYDPPISEKEINNIKDGIYYFHIQFKNENGWGAISHFRFQIDTTPPAPIEIKFIDGKETTNPRPAILFNTVDELSGVEYYKVKIEDKEASIVNQSVLKGNPYTLPPQTPGKKSIIVQAFDYAGNYTTAVDEFTILPIESPKITNYPELVLPEENLVLKGTAIPNTKITVYLQKDNDEPKTEETQTDGSGNWTFVSSKKLEAGVYKIWLIATDQNGAQSNPTDPIVIQVNQPFFIRIAKTIFNYLNTIISVLILLFVLIFGIVWFAIRIKRKKKRIKSEFSDLEKALYKSFDMLRTDIKRQLELLDNEKGLSEREKMIYNSLKKSLENSEEALEKEVKKIEKEL